MPSLRLFTAAVATVLLLAQPGAVAIPEALPYRYEDAVRGGKYCRVSYCPSSEVVDWSCGAICAAVPTFQSYRFLQNASTDAFGFTGVDPTHEQIVVAFRGSSSMTNWFENLDFLLTEYDAQSACGADCKVHEGFYGVYLSVRAPVRTAVTAVLSDFPGYQILVAGHSLGGVVALLCAVDLQEQLNRDGGPAKPVSLYTMDAPRVGNPACATWTAQLLAKDSHYRITHKRDPVPHLPPMWIGFLHAPTEVFYETDASSSMRVCADTTTAEDEDCSDDMFAVVISDHLEYLGDSTGCSCTGCVEADVAVTRDLPSSPDAPSLPWKLYARLTWEYVKHRMGVRASN